MGIEAALGLVSLVVGVAGGIGQMNAANSAAAAQTAANTVNNNKSTVNSIEDERQRVREDRVRRAAIINADTNDGTTASSGESGSLAALDTNFGTLISGSKFNSAANTAINADNQTAENDINQENTIKGLTSLTQNSLNTLGTVFSSAAKNSVGTG